MNQIVDGGTARHAIAARVVPHMRRQIIFHKVEQFLAKHVKKKYLKAFYTYRGSTSRPEAYLGRFKHQNKELQFSKLLSTYVSKVL